MAKKSRLHNKVKITFLQNYVIYILTAHIFCIIANGQGTVIFSTSIPGALTPSAAAGLDDGRTGFVKVLEQDNVTKWTQTVNGIPVYGSVLTTHNDQRGI